MPTTALTEVKTLLERAKTMTREALQELFSTIPEEVKHAYYTLKKASYFVSENANTSCRREHLSPSGQFKLVVTPFATSPGAWNYTQGLVYRIGSEEPLAEIRRNYSSFPFLFVGDHPKGLLLIAGEDYQGQTVIELDTGRRRDFLPKEANEGHGFCWSDYEFHAATQVLVVEGCYWACPYEFKFYDFADPMEKGWPLLETECCIDSDRKPPILSDDGTITVFQTQWEHPEDEDNEDFDEDTAPRVDAVIKKFKRENGKLTLVSEWVSEAEQKCRKEREESNARWEAWKADFLANDPLHLAYKARMKSDTWLNPQDYYSHGVTYDNWCPDWKERETRWCRRIHNHKGKKGYTLDFEWAVKTGPVKLQVFKDGDTHETKFWMDHSVESVNAAFDYAKSFLVT